MSERQKKGEPRIIAIFVLALSLAVVFVSACRVKGKPTIYQERKESTECEDTLSGFHFGNAAEEQRATYPAKVGRKELERAIDECAKYLVRMCDAEGKFTYRVNIDPTVEVKPRYNMVRHAGTIYSLVDYYHWKNDQQVLDAVNRALGFMKKKGIGPVPESGGLSAVWSPPELEGRTGEPMQAKLGGTALGLVAAIGVEKINPGIISLDELTQMGRFIVFMQKEDGSFYSKYIPYIGGREDSWTSLYYPGEAALALVMLYVRDGSPVWLNAALHAVGYLAKIREPEDQVEADHWVLIATEMLLDHYEKTDKSVSRDLLEKHAFKIVSCIMRNRPYIPDTSPLHGMLISEGRTTPTATRLEGLLAMFDVVNNTPSMEPDKVAEAIRGGIAFLVRSQIREGEFKGGIPRAIRREPDAPLYYNDRATEIRIDYVQHTLSAMIRYAESPLAD